MKKILIDKRMRTFEKNKLKSIGYELIEIKKSEKVYEEISSHVDIFCTKINDILIAEKSSFEYLKKYFSNEIIEGNSFVNLKYPNDIRYNVCILGKSAIHNFKYTDEKVIEILKKQKYEFINVKQGYTNCSIAVIDEKSAITTDIGIYNKLKEKNYDILLIKDSLDIKLLCNKEYSKMKGFLGGAISRIENKIFITGDLEKIDKEEKIKKFIKNKNLEIIDFKGQEIVDYGGIICFK